MGAHKPASHEHDHGTDARLLHLIAEKEKELEARAAAALAEAASLVAAARAEAEQMLGQARERAAADAQAHEQRVAEEVTRIESDLVSRGTKEVEALRRQAAAGAGAAVRLVVERIVKGTSA